MQKKISLTFFLLMFAYGVQSQQHSIKGKVSTEAMIPVSGSHIHIGKKTVASDDSGNYVITNLPSGKLDVHVSYIGYQPIDTIILLNADVTLDFKLKQSINQLSDVYVKQGKNTLNKSILEQKLKIETIENIATNRLVMP